ncbi:MAG: hypothetical protein GEV28_14950 [Actinophytocola sp.]|uniref:hypothetical protein n=1 Tax=Actinophytocola sp. TaxID=1872138 RepID=UPI00132C74B7|nr:hypothetical protein [Actinophytocola sp.]MPZ81621.1 hypothetical protein [Actinophytocola sp.]
MRAVQRDRMFADFAGTRARRTDSADTAVVVTETLPTPNQAWPADATGRRYRSEPRPHRYDRSEAGDDG